MTSAGLGEVSCPEGGGPDAWHPTGLAEVRPAWVLPEGGALGLRGLAGGLVGPGPDRRPRKDGRAQATVNGPLCSTNPAHLAGQMCPCRPAPAPAGSSWQPHTARGWCASWGLWEPRPSGE